MKGSVSAMQIAVVVYDSGLTSILDVLDLTPPETADLLVVPALAASSVASFISWGRKG
jgi:hypothetical protein